MNSPHADDAPPARPSIPSAAELAALPSDGGPEWNRLVFSQSPYLLQHAANPVDWYPWGEEAFAAARARNCPIFLSIGYSTCHWCHVMEHESFEDDEVAGLMNRYFVAIKVDREERPDVDSLHMTVCQALTGRGGWPLTVILTPDRKPFFAGTYFPKHGRYGQPGMMQLLPALGEAWSEQNAEVVQQAEQLAAALQSLADGAPGPALGAEALGRAYTQFRGSFDDEWGGFGSNPKFPTPHNLSFLLRYGDRHPDSNAVAMVEATLRAMRRGGIHDHVGGGYHRYSTDREWLVPHFEKMLYDQALVTIAAVEAFQVTGNAEDAAMVDDILAYVRRDMTSPEGGFYSAEDADSEGEEGKFYVWTTAEVRSILGDEAPLFIDVYSLSDRGNFAEEASGRAQETNIPHRRASWKDLAARHKLDEGALRERMAAARARLFEVRERRIHPLKDDKILTDWNGLMIAAMAKAGRALGNPEYVAAARRAADYVLAHLRDRDGRLYKRARLGKAGLDGLVDDYAFVVWGLIELYEASFEPRYLRAAVELNRTMAELFWDEENGGLFIAPSHGEQLLVRNKEVYDGAVPSGNSVAAGNMLRLARLTGDTEGERRADALMRAFSGQVGAQPRAHTQMMTAVDFMLGPTREVVLVGNPADAAFRAFAAPLRESFLPRVVVLQRPEDAAAAASITELAPFIATQRSLEGKPTAYVCENFACQAPTNDAAQLRASLGLKGSTEGR